MGRVMVWTLILGNAAAAVIFLMGFVASVLSDPWWRSVLFGTLFVLNGVNSALYFIASREPVLDDGEAEVWGME